MLYRVKENFKIRHGGKVYNHETTSDILKKGLPEKAFKFNLEAGYIIESTTKQVDADKPANAKKQN